MCRLSMYLSIHLRCVLPLYTTLGAAAMKDIEWGTWTLPFGWAAKGVWPIAGNDPGMEVTCAKRSGDSSLLAVGDNFG